MNQLRNSKRGSVLLGTIVLALLGATVIGGYLSMTLNEYKLSQRTLLLQSAMNLAEAGLEEGMDGINSVDDDGIWRATGWTAVGGNGYYKDITGFTFSDSRAGQVRVYVEDYDTLPILVSEGRITDARGDVISKQIRVDLEKAGPFSNGIMAKETISFAGNPVSVDAYDSTLGDWNSTLNRLDEGTIASLSIDNGALDVGNGDVWGYVATGGGAPDVGASGSIMGADTPAGVTEDPPADEIPGLPPCGHHRDFEITRP